MPAWLIRKPLDVGESRERYLSAIDDATGRIETTLQPICAKRFVSAAVARAYASRHDDLME